MENLISVIVCTYNQERTIVRTLDSILMQQCHVPYEIIIGEDCSTDTTLTICQQYAERYPDIVRLLANKTNKGIVDNYFNCILNSNGIYIADCAGDDFWVDPLKLEKEVTILEKHPNVTLVHTDWVKYQESTGRTYPSPKKPFTAPITDGHIMLEAIIIQRELPVIQLCTSVYRTSIIRDALSKNEALFRNKDFGCEDLQIATLMSACGKIAYIPNVTLNYSQGENTVSHSPDYHKQFLFTRQVTHQSYLLAQHYQIKTLATEQFFRQRVFELVMFAFRAHDKQLLTETLQYEKEWNIQRSYKTSLLFHIMRYECLWITALQVRHIFINVKRLFH
jgi:Glycosyltransferases involved in cell wall biogenesis